MHQPRCAAQANFPEYSILFQELEIIIAPRLMQVHRIWCNRFRHSHPLQLRPIEMS